MMLDQFYSIVKDKNVVAEATRLLHAGKDDKLFIDYFGVNYDQDNLISVKLYFSFLNVFPSQELLKEFIGDEEIVKLVNENWSTSDEFTFLHQGFTFGLKCYLKNGKVEINKYIHFRTKEYLLGYANEIDLTESDKSNFAGLCLENHSKIKELKKYFYLTSDENKNQIIKDFDLDKFEVKLEDITMVEYTESKIEKKINLILSNSTAVKRFIECQNNQPLIDLSKHFFDKYKLYYYGPGLRYNSDTKAIYYLPKELYYGLKKVNLVQQLINV